MMKLQKCLFIALFSIAGLWATVQAHEHTASPEQKAIAKLVDGLHESASKADLKAYLGAFTENGVFMGTDDWERWTRPTTLDEYVSERFKGGTGWTYKSVERHIKLNEAKDIGWFDEIIVSEKWGRFRGTGVVVKQQEEWKIAHYSMSVLVANEAFFDIAEINKKAFVERAKK